MRIIHYINQFYAQIGGEEAAYTPLEVRNGALGPGVALQSMLKDSEIVATIICGDNYFVENSEIVEEQIKEAIHQYAADIVVAGPAFNAGRYGMACGGVCKIAFNAEVIAISSLYKENPGLELYKVYGYIFPSHINARGMREALSKIAAFINKIAAGEEILTPDVEGYFKRGIRINTWKEKTGAQRAVDMALDKALGRPFKTEIEVPIFDRIVPSKPVADLSKAKVALITTGGIVPKGNPDRMEALSASKWVEYPLEAFGDKEWISECEVAHGGYDPTFGNEDGNRVLPIDAMLSLEEDGFIGEMYKKVFVTVGNCMEVVKAERYGNEIAARLRDQNIQCAILTST